MQVDKVEAPGSAIVYTVSSKVKQLGVAAPFVVTVTLWSQAPAKTFYDKHVLRLNESSREIWAERKSSMDNSRCFATWRTRRCRAWRSSRHEPGGREGQSGPRDSARPHLWLRAGGE